MSLRALWTGRLLHIYHHYLVAFRKWYSAQHALIQMLEKWKGTLDNGENIGTILMGSSNEKFWYQ